MGVATASRVLRGDPQPLIGVKTRERVLDAARRLKYRHNLQARQLRTGRSEVVGILAWGLSGGVNLARYQAVERAIRAGGYRALMGHAAGDEELRLQLAKEFASSAVEGVIVLNTGGAHDAAVQVLVERGVPIVSMEPLEGLSADVVTVDRRAGAHLVTKHLLELGHRRIAFLCGKLTVPANAERFQGYREALGEHGCSPDEALLVRIARSDTWGHYGQGYEAGQRLLAVRPLPTAVFCNNDEVAIGAMRSLGEAGIRIPEDVAMAGFDDAEAAAYAPVPLTTLAQPVQEQAARAVSLLFERIAKPDEERQPHAIRLTPRLVVRASCGAAAGRKRICEH
ncbi:MAG: LacI family DNA-binding transcriptional regulator [Armatimonadetes bacterium]|nr:LacI family DNA-binding transcriptional regulator [Armatimonadota bacterium]